MSAASYRDVMLDWAVAELMSPHWRTLKTWTWAHPDWEAWRNHVRRQGPRAWTPAQEATLISTLERAREPIISRYGPRRNWAFERLGLPADAISKLQVMPDFFPPGGTLGQLAQWIAAKPDYAPEKTEAVMAMAAGSANGRKPYGCLIVVHDAVTGSTLVEGYKRALAAIAMNRQETDAHLCAPPGPTQG